MISTHSSLDNMKWHYGNHTSTVRQNPSQNQHFVTDADNYVLTLIREDIQNRLDANDEYNKIKGYKNDQKKRLKLVYRLTHLKQKGVWFKSLKPHLAAVQNKSFYKPQLLQKTTIPILNMECYNTIGLDGDLDSAVATNPNDHYKWFMFNDNISAKSSKPGSRGRNGVGKHAYNMVSKIGTYFILSCRYSDNKTILTGKSVLKCHSYSGKHFEPYGFFKNEEKNERFCSSDEILINNYKEDFSLDRKDDKCGTSISIPFYDDKITYDEIRVSILESYMNEIFEGNIDITIYDGDKSLHITDETVMGIVENLDDEYITLKNRYNFYQEIENKRKGTIENFELNKVKNLREITKSDFKEGDFDKAIKALYGEKICNFEIPLDVESKQSGKKASSYFNVYLKKDFSFVGRDETYIRSGLTITGERSITRSRIRSLVKIEKNEMLSDLLGDAENISHTKWIPKSADNFIAAEYRKGDGIVTYVRKAPDRLLSLLEELQDDTIKGAASDIFSIPKKNPKPSPRPEPDPDPVPEISASKFKTVSLSDPYGFKVCKNPDHESEVKTIRLKFGYAQEGGNWRNHDILDFDITKTKPIKVEYTGAEVEFRNPNEIMLNILDQNFEISIHGFDKNRDVILAPPRT